MEQLRAKAAPPVLRAAGSCHNRAMPRETMERDESAGIRQEFLDWRYPALPAAVEYLLGTYRRNDIWDLDRVAIVLPGARAGRRLRELLLAKADGENVVFFPPRIGTVGQLPEWLYEAKLPFASPMEQRLAWAAALRQTPATVLVKFLPQLPTQENDPQWLEWGSLLWRQHRELAGEGLDFQQVADGGAVLDEFHEAERWHALSAVQRRYLRILDSIGLWDRQTARLYAIEHHECQIDVELLLIGAVDMNRSLRQMLDAVARQVTVLIHADPQMADHFDRFGCLRPERWLEAVIPLPEEGIQQVDGPDDQCRAVVQCLNEWQPSVAACEVTVGVPDESLVPLLEQHLQAGGYAVRWGPGRPMEAGRPVRWLRAVVDLLQQNRFENLAELMRHPDTEAWLQQQFEWSAASLCELDQHQHDHLVQQAEDALWEKLPEDAPIRQASKCVNNLLRDLRGEPRTAGAWADPILQILHQIYGDLQLDRDQSDARMIVGCCETLRDAFLQMESIAATLLPDVTAEQAILLALESLRDQLVPPPAQPDAVELLGWLELPLDDASALVVTSLNEGVIPTSVNSDAFLPDALRSELGVDDNARRYARDAYALTVLAKTRSRLRLVVGRRTWEGDPLIPSRLLLANDAEHFLRLSQRLFGPVAEDADQEPLTQSPGMDPLVVPQPEATSWVGSLNVTDFKSYLECPYRFYLARVLRLKRFTDDAMELDAMAFGELLHRVLDEFGRGPLKDSSDEEEIAEALTQQLKARAQARFGFQPPPALRIQLTQLEQRLRAFAKCQADWRRAGWQIVHSERTVTTTRTPWSAEAWAVPLKGRIDRIDRQEGTDRWAVLDYKSSDRGELPRKTHHRRASKGTLQPEDWVDLQLPLYRYLARATQPPVEGSIELGYVLLPRDSEETAFRFADWTDAELRTADEAARRIARQIVAGSFWPPAAASPYGADDFSAICQEGVFRRRLEGAPCEESR